MIFPEIEPRLCQTTYIEDLNDLLGCNISPPILYDGAIIRHQVAHAEHIDLYKSTGNIELTIQGRSCINLTLSLSIVNVWP